MRIFLDDDRNHPLGEDWTVVRTVEDMLDLVDRHDDEIEEISFDNDLRQELDGIHGLNAIRERLLDRPGRLPALRRVTVHSLNGDAARAMSSDLACYVRHGLLPDVEIRRRPAEGRPYPLADEDGRGIIPHRRAA
jgi:hypothetical protein